MLNFWTSEPQLPGATVERAVALLSDIYSPSHEKDYLAYSTSLLLERTSRSPDYNRVMFERPLSDCDFAVRTNYYVFPQVNL
jgi:DNA-dependent protein kinase catalytic subunit